MAKLTDVIIYSKENCPYCDKAKMLLKTREIDFTELSLNRDFYRDEILELFPSARTFPIIVVNGSYIGGFSQLLEQIDNFFGKMQING